MYPRFLITLNEELNSVPVTVRVGQVSIGHALSPLSVTDHILQAVDVVGQAGKPRTISGFQTHQTPVWLSTTERAELTFQDELPEDLLECLSNNKLSA